MTYKTKLKKLKSTDLNSLTISLAVIKEYKSDRISHYDLKYVRLVANLEQRLKGILVRHIENSNTVENYTVDCLEPEADHVKAINYEETDFQRILTKLQESSPEEDVIENVNELLKAKSYLIILRNQDGIQVVGFKTLTENWKLRRNRGLIPLMFQDHTFKDLENDNVFSISQYIDFFYFENSLFILSKREFEKGLNFREGMINNAEQLYLEVNTLNLFANIDLLKTRVGNNQRYLRKIAMIRNLGYYKQSSFLKKLKTLNAKKGWNIEFKDDQIVITDETFEDILTLLQNKRLHSEITEEDFDVDNAKLLD